MSSEQGYETVLEIKDLGISFSTDEGDVRAVNGVSFALKKGITLGIVGESGSGKTATTQSILGLLSENARIDNCSKVIFKHPQKGIIDLIKLGKNDTNWSDIRGRYISMVFQEPSASFSPIYRIRDYFYETMDLHLKIKDKNKREEFSLEMLSKVGIPDPKGCFGRYPFELSGGMKQRVMIAIALLTHPLVVIADEPTSALDVVVQAQILLLLRKLQQDLGMSLIFVSHDFGVIRQIADEVAIMYLGEVVEYGSIKQITASPFHPYTKLLLGAIPRFEHRNTFLSSVPGDIPSPLNRPSGCPLHTRCPSIIKGLCDKSSPNFLTIKGKHKVRCFFCEKLMKEGN